MNMKKFGLKIYLGVMCILLTSCASESRDLKMSNTMKIDVQKNTYLAISPNGGRLIVAQGNASNFAGVILVELQDTKVISTRKIDLPKNTFTFSFAKNNNEVLVTTLKKDGSSDFLKINLDSNSEEIVYASTSRIRFPLEVSDHEYVFLEGSGDGNRNSKWRRYKNKKNEILNNEVFNLSSSLNVVNGSLFLLEPRTPPIFRTIYGPLPMGIKSLVDDSTFSIICADANNLICLKSTIHLVDERYISKIMIFNDRQKCEIPGNWVDVRESYISKDGSIIVFQAAIKDFDGPRKIFIVKNKILNCIINSI